MVPPRLMAIAVASKGVGLVFLVDRQLTDWRISEGAAHSPSDTERTLRRWIRELQPDVLVTELVEPSMRKRARARTLIAVALQVGQETGIPCVPVAHGRRFANKYLEAEDIGTRYPELAPWVPKRRRIQDHESRNVLIFEAIVLAETFFDGPAARIAAALG